MPLELSESLKLAVAFVLLASGIAKIVAPSPLRRLISDAVVSGRLSLWIVGALAVAELGLGTGLALDRRWAEFGAGGLLTILTVGLVLLYRSGSKLPCGCLGDLTASKIGPAPIVRNLLLLAMLVLGRNAEITHPAAVAPAFGCAVLVFLAPEAAQVISELHALRVAETGARSTTHGEARV